MESADAMTYYCEIKSQTLRPTFDGYKIEAKTDAEALDFFKKKHGDDLIFAYDEDLRPIYDKAAEGSAAKVQ